MRQHLNFLTMYEVKLKNRVNQNESDWRQGHSQFEASEKAKDNYLKKYPGDNLEDTEYVIQPVRSGLENITYPEVTLDEMVNAFRNAQRTNFRPRGLAEANDSADSLFDLVQASKEAPGSTTIAVVDHEGPTVAPGGGPTQDALAIYNDMLTLSSLASVVAMQGIYEDHPEEFDVTDPKQAAEFIRAQVNKLNDTFSRRLGAYAIVGENISHNFTKTVSAADLHLSFLTDLFSSFSFPEKAFVKLDAILNEVKDALVNLKFGLDKEHETVDHMVFVNYIEAMDVEGLEEKILVGKIRMFYLRIDQKSWKASIAKSTVSKEDFIVNYFDRTLTINSNLVRSDISSITELITKFTNRQFDEMRELTSPTVVER